MHPTIRLLSFSNIYIFLKYFGSGWIRIYYYYFRIYNYYYYYYYYTGRPLKTPIKTPPATAKRHLFESLANLKRSLARSGRKIRKSRAKILRGCSYNHTYLYIFVIIIICTVEVVIREEGPTSFSISFFFPSSSSSSSSFSYLVVASVGLPCEMWDLSRHMIQLVAALHRLRLFDALSLLSWRLFYYYIYIYYYYYRVL
jgi:hypothetical protein